MRFFDQALKIDPKNALAHLSRANVNIARDKFRPLTRILIPSSKPRQTISWQITCAAWSSPSSRNLPKPIGYSIASALLSRGSGGLLPAGGDETGTRTICSGESILGKYLSRVPDDMRAVRLIASAALQQRAASRAIEYLKPLLDKMPADAATLAVLGNAYVADGKPDLACSSSKKPPLSIRMTRRSRQGSAFRRSTPGRVSKVSRHSSKCSLPTRRIRAGPTLVVSELRARRFDKAAEVASSLINRDAKNPIYHTLLGVVRAAQRDYPGAESAFRAALRSIPNSRRPHAIWRSCTQRLGAWTKPRRYTEICWQRDRRYYCAPRLADIYISEKRWPEATDVINRARTVAGSNSAPASSWSASTSCVKIGTVPRP